MSWRLKDPYEEEGEWVNKLENVVPLLPNLCHGDITHYLVYLVYGISAYTLSEFKNYKSLESHDLFTSGWVGEPLLIVINSRAVVLCKVQHSMGVNSKPPVRAWVMINQNGSVECAHRECMAGIAETCSHVGAILFKIEYAVRLREAMRVTVTDVAAYS